MPACVDSVRSCFTSFLLLCISGNLRQKRMLPGHVPVKQYETRSFRSPKEKRKCHIWTCKSTNLQSQLFLESMEKTTLRFWHIFGKNREHRFTRRPLENLCFFFAGKRQLPRKGKLPPTIFVQKISQPGAFCFTSCRAMFQGLLLGALRNFVLSKACTKCSPSRGGLRRHREGSEKATTGQA